VILAMSVTGVLLAFERQILAWAERDLRATAVEAQQKALPVSAIVAAAAAASPDAKPSNLTFRSDPLAPVTVAFGRERTLFVNRYSGKVLGEGATGWRKFFHVNEDIHRWLAMEGEGRAVGKKITGYSNVAFFFIVLSGLYIWIPKKKTRAGFRNISLFRGGLRGKARDFNWHNVLGIWSFVPLVLIVYSGIAISFPSRPAGGGPGGPGGAGGPGGGPQVERSAAPRAPRAESERGARPEGERRGNEAGRGERRGAADAAKLDRLFDSARAEADRLAPQWRSLGVRLPLRGEGPVTFSMDTGNGARPDKRSQLMLDPRSAQLVEHKTYASQKREQKIRAWLRWIHTGEAGGILGQIVAALASAAAVVLVWTGIALALRRLRRWLQGAPQPQPNTNKNSEFVEEVFES